VGIWQRERSDAYFFAGEVGATGERDGGGPCESPWGGEKFLNGRGEVDDTKRFQIWSLITRKRI